jgi:hypothetical protein
MPTYASYAGEIAAQLTHYRELGHKEGSKNRPPQDSATPDQHEGKLRSEAEKWLASEQRLLDSQVVEASKAAIDAKQKVVQLKSTLDQLVVDDTMQSTVDDQFAGERSALVRAVGNRLRAEAAYNYVRARNDIHEEPSYPDSIIWHFGVLAVFGLIETVTNAFFYENSQGLLGGFFVALAIAALNMVTAMVLGYWFRFKNLREIDKQLLGWFALAVFVVTTVFFNALFASFRSEYQVVVDPGDFKQVGEAFQKAWPEALRVFRADMSFKDMWSFILFGLGLLLSLGGFWKGYTLDDKYPGHGKAAKALRAAEAIENDSANVLRLRIKDLIHQRKAAVQAALQEPSTQIGMLGRRIGELTHARDSLQSQAMAVRRDFDLVRDVYRQANAAVRTVPTPQFFLDKQPLVTTIDPESAEGVVVEMSSVQEELKLLREAYQDRLNSKLKELQGDATTTMNSAFQAFLSEVRKEAEENIARATPTMHRVQAA